MLHLQTTCSWFKPHCPQTCKNMCRPLKNPGKKLKRLMINSMQLNLKNCNHIPLSTEGTFLSGSAPRGTIRAARVASKRAARAARAERKQHTHHAQNAQNAQHGVLEADLEADFRHAQNA